MKQNRVFLNILLSCSKSWCLEEHTVRWVIVLRSVLRHLKTETGSFRNVVAVAVCVCDNIKVLTNIAHKTYVKPMSKMYIIQLQQELLMRGSHIPCRCKGQKDSSFVHLRLERPENLFDIIFVFLL